MLIGKIILQIYFLFSFDYFHAVSILLHKSQLIPIPYVRFSIPQEWNQCGGKNQIE